MGFLHTILLLPLRVESIKKAVSKLEALAVQSQTSLGAGYVYGSRVPLIVISAYGRPAYISHVNHDFGSILYFVEEVFNLSSLGYAYSNADDLSDCFNIYQEPFVFKTIDAPLTADHFLHDTSPPADPDDE